MASTRRAAFYLETILANSLPKAQAGLEACCESLSRIAGRARSTQWTPKGAASMIRFAPCRRGLTHARYGFDPVAVLQPVCRDEETPGDHRPAFGVVENSSVLLNAWVEDGGAESIRPYDVERCALTVSMLQRSVGLQGAVEKTRGLASQGPCSSL